MRLGPLPLDLSHQQGQEKKLQANPSSGQRACVAVGRPRIHPSQSRYPEMSDRRLGYGVVEMSFSRTHNRATFTLDSEGKRAAHTAPGGWLTDVRGYVLVRLCLPHLHELAPSDWRGVTRYPRYCSEFLAPKHQNSEPNLHECHAFAHDAQKSIDCSLVL